MFSFEVPQWAMLHVTLPTGGEAQLVHVGGGRFLSRVPPIAFTGMRPDIPLQQEGLPVAWDGATLAGTVQPCVFGFDLAGATRAVEEAAAAGDPFAQAMLEEFAAAEQQLQAQDALRESMQKPVELTEAQKRAAGVEG